MTEEQQRRGPAATQIEATGENVRANVARLRKARGLTTYQLATALKAAGRAIPQSGISRIESGARRVDVDDLTALAVVFGVSPQALLLPLTDRPDENVEITGRGEVDALTAWEWGIGRLPLKTTPGREKTELLEHRLFGMPQWLLDHVSYNVIGRVDDGRLELSQDLRATIDADRTRFERETGETVDSETFTRLWMQARFGGSDG
ncbi:helix-turn-helix domain-containing protein [Streptomyces sp. NPDC005141]